MVETDQAVKAAAQALAAETGDTVAEERAAAALSKIIQAGQGDGDLQPDVTVEDLYPAWPGGRAEGPDGFRPRR